MKRIIITLPILLAAVPAVAQSGPSEAQQRMACMGDALRLCSQHIPDRDQIIACLHSQRESLSAGCRPVFDASRKAYLSRHRVQRLSERD